MGLVRGVSAFFSGTAFKYGVSGFQRHGTEVRTDVSGVFRHHVQIRELAEFFGTTFKYGS